MEDTKQVEYLDDETAKRAADVVARLHWFLYTDRSTPCPK